MAEAEAEARAARPQGLLERHVPAPGAGRLAAVGGLTALFARAAACAAVRAAAGAAWAGASGAARRAGCGAALGLAPGGGRAGGQRRRRRAARRGAGSDGAAG